MSYTTLPENLDIIGETECLRPLTGSYFTSTGLGKIDRIFLSRDTFIDLRKFGRDWLDLETLAENLDKGIYGKFLGADLIILKNAEKDKVYCVKESKCFLINIKENPRYTASNLRFK